ncbi:MAG: heme-binding protein [Acidibrevibacterium sp.]|jgi:uncharacterized protein GlcG (DUF336 family)|uniref:GlcG/HbpS family heme-binding protein n=1 Tax=Acidibrevibacterium fodinaquatile TaxID=1969806 RepID=UPI000E0CBF5B|nr:heme-binding protein [Acidibrevibacterium fodinaquatile]MCA7120396.1 heme-binding protein [Acidibrevibacterium fodinaquatile]
MPSINRKTALSLLALLATLAGGARAQAPLPAGVPEQMPYDLPYGTSITLAEAKTLAAAAEAEAARHHWKMAISVVGPEGKLIYFERMDDTQQASIAVSEHKARTAALYRRATKIFQDAADGGHPYVLSLDDAIAVEGGFPLVRDGKLIGAIGCSGGMSVQDGVTCKAGLAALK